MRIERYDKVITRLIDATPETRCTGEIIQEQSQCGIQLL